MRYEREEYISYLDSKDFDEFFDLAKHLYTSMCEWQPTKARKRHEDEFEDTIEPGEIYYRRAIGEGYSSVLKLSRRSMERVLATMFMSNPKLTKLAKQYRDNFEQESREAMSKVSFDFIDSKKQ